MASIFGNIENPFGPKGLNVPSLATGTSGEGLILILNNLLKFAIVLAAVYTFWNLITAGYMFMSAGGDPKAIGKAWDKIWQSLIGLLIVVSSFILAAVFGLLLFGNPTILIAPRVFAP